MKIDKSQIIDMLKSRGDEATARDADNELPDQVDTEKHQDLLNRFGIDLKDLTGKIPGLAELGL